MEIILSSLININNKSKRGSMKSVLFFILIMVTVVPAQDKSDYSPKLSGYIRALQQTDFSTNQGEFLVKMARFSIKGNVNEYAGYRFQVDVTRLGKLTTTSATVNGTKVLTGASASFSDILLDAEAFIAPVKNLSLSLGQFKVPFGTDNLRGGADIDFVNRPLLTNVAPGLRDVGFMGTYTIKDGVPVEFKAGVFNGAGQNKTENDKSVNYSFRASVIPVSGVTLAANYYGGKASGADLGIYDLGFDYKLGKAFVSGEFGQRKTKTSVLEFNSTSYFVYALYEFSFTESLVSAIIPAVRYENYDPNGSTADNEIGKITAGLGFQFAKIKMAQFRINYELFDYKDGRTNPNKLIFELQTKF